MADITLLPSAKVPLIYDGELTMTTEWYRFFWNIYGFTGTGVVPVNRGGTGLNTIGDHQIIIGNANNVFEPASLSSSSITITYPAGFVNLELGTSTVTPGTYGSASQVGVFTVNQYGVLTAASNTSIGIDASQIISGTIASARISGSYTGITGVGTLTAGTWNATTIGVAYGGTGQTSFTNGQLLIGNTTGNTLTKATLTAGTGVTITNGAGSITISATGSGGTVTAVTGVAPIASSGGTTPAISISQATTSTDGYLSSTDWNTFNNKQPAGTYVTSVTGTSPVVSSGGTTPAISLATAYGDTLNPYASKTANYFLAAPNGSAGVPTFRAMVAADVPALAYVTSVSGTGTVNGITLTGTVTSSGSLTLGGTLSGIGNSQLTNSTISGVALGGNLFNLTAGTGVSFSAGTTYNGSAAITINATGTGGTVTSVAALTLGTTGTDLSSTVANSTTTPVITLNVPTASATNRGALSAADWITFNGKAPAVTYTTNYVPYGQGTTSLNQSAGLQFNGSNLGINIASSAWGSTFRATQIGSYGAFIAGQTGQAQVFVGTNAYYNGANWVYLNSATASRYYQATGSHVWDTAGAGTAGNTITFTQAMTLDAAGQLGVGVTSMAVPSGSRRGLQVSNGTNGGALLLNNSTTDTNNPRILGTSTNDLILSGGGATGVISAYTNGTEVIRVFASSGVSIGNTTDPGATNLSVTGSSTSASFIPSSSTVPTNGLYLPAANTIGWATNSTAAMRVNSTQDVLINSTAIVQTSKFSVSFDGVARNGFGMNDTTGTAASVGYQNFLRNGAGVGSITYSSGSGLIAYNVTSDYRLKENVIDLPNGLSTVLKLKPRQFDWKNTGNTTTGFIAHELQDILPHAVTGEKDAVDNEQNPVYQQMDSSFLIATLVKSIQELNAKFDEYVASHP
jgi:hypothetical protein